jgi:hypothetical protein
LGHVTVGAGSSRTGREAVYVTSVCASRQGEPTPALASTVASTPQRTHMIAAITKTSRKR